MPTIILLPPPHLFGQCGVSASANKYTATCLLDDHVGGAELPASFVSLEFSTTSSLGLRAHLILEFQV